MARYDRSARTGNDRTSLYDDITDKIIAELEAGRVPWVQPWGTPEAKAPLAMPRNAATGRQYSGINILILWGAVIEHGYAGQSWLTYLQAKSLGGKVRKGEHGTVIVYADRFIPDDERERAREASEEPHAIPFLKRFTVFNAAQCEGLPEDVAIEAPPPPPHMIEPRVEALIRATGIDFRIGGNQAFYVPAHDYVQVPPPQAYFEPIDWHRTALHELGHNAVTRIMPHGVRWRLVGQASATRQFGIIRALPGTRGADHRAGSGSTAWLGRPRGRVLSPSTSCRHGCRSGWSRRSRDRARVRLPFGQRRCGAGPLQCCGAAYAA
ncbi:ArdC family protein [Aliihoeflea sp. PC F10.4]